MGKVLIFVGLILLVAGGAVLFLQQLHFPIGRLPGDILIKRGNMTIYLPFTTCLLLSIALILLFRFVKIP
jgi:hypothetical protein